MSFHRVVVALDTSGSLAALATASGLARAMEAELVGLFVEDVDLLAFAALPFAGEVGFASAQWRALDVATMERSLRAQARRIREALGKRLAGEPVKWTFEVVRGTTFTALASVAAERDLAVVTVRRGADRARADIARAIGTLPTALLIVPESTPPPRMIAVVAPAQAAPREIAALVASLSTHYGRAALFVTADGEPARRASWQRETAALLAEQGIAARFRAAGAATRAEVARILAAEHPRLVVALAPSPALRAAWVDALPYPVLVLPQPAPRTPSGEG